MASKPQLHIEHIHCIDCGNCMDLPITMLIDIELERRSEDMPEDIGYLCDVCAT